MENKLELQYRMYGFVPYNLSEIQKGIQFGHAVVEYGQIARGLKGLEEIYNKWANTDKTFIILNGGTTNNNPNRLGTLNQYKNEFVENKIIFVDFSEPDLGDQLTAFVFLVDERVYDKEKYPDFANLPYYWDADKEPKMDEFFKWNDDNNSAYEKWVESIGGEKNLFLRNFLWVNV